MVAQSSHTTASTRHGRELLATLRTTFHSAKAREISGESGSILDELTGEWKVKGLSALPASLSSDAHADCHFRTELVEGMGIAMGMGMGSWPARSKANCPGQLYCTCTALGLCKLPSFRHVSITGRRTGQNATNVL